MNAPQGDEFSERLRRLGEAQELERDYFSALRRRAVAALLVALGCVGVMLLAWWSATWRTPQPANPTVVVVPVRGAP